MGRSAFVAAITLAAVLAACGTATQANPEPPAAKASPEPREASAMGGAPFVRTADGEVFVSCGDGDEGWPPSVMAEGVPGVLSEGEAAKIFQDILDDPNTGEEAGLTLFRDGVDVQWRVLRRDGDSLTIGLGRWTTQGPVGEGVYTLDLEREGDAWRVSGWGDCTQMALVLKEGRSRVELKKYRADTTSTQLTATVNERECVSGRNPERFLHEPYVVETARSVTIYWTSDPPTGFQDCQGNPSVDRVVELTDPLGSRSVFDGLSYPPRPVRMH